MTKTRQINMHALEMVWKEICNENGRFYAYEIRIQNDLFEDKILAWHQKIIQYFKTENFEFIYKRFKFELLESFGFQMYIGWYDQVHCFSLFI